MIMKRYACRLALPALAVALAALVPAFAQAPSSGPQPSVEIRAVRVDKAPSIDGALSDDAWSAAAPFTAFRMVEPRPNGDPTERTELRVLYDDANLYIGILCRDSEPLRIAGNSMAHDTGQEMGGGGYGYMHGLSKPSDDLIRILIDPFLNKRTAYVFYVNPRGARSEGLASGGQASLDWDGIWEAESAVGPDGWSAEVRIPFKTISFNPALAAWGLNVERYIPRKLETIRVSGVRLDSRFENPMEAAALTGIAGVHQGMGITFRPYSLGRLTNDRLTPPAGTQGSFDGGFDLYKNFTPNLVGVVSGNMDFAETEVDERRINLTRFPLYFPEKRMFFLEGSDTFSFSSSISFIPFFSRKVGLFNGQQVPVLFGSKLYGRVGRTNLAFLDVQTGKYEGMPGRNLLAARMTQDLWSESKVGWIFTNGSPDGTRNSLAGVDFNYSTSKFAGNKNLQLAAWTAYNWNERRDGEHFGFGARANYPNDLWNVQSTYAYYGKALDPGLGYMMRQGIQTFFLDVRFQPRPSGGWLDKVVRQFVFSGSGDFYWEVGGGLETARWNATPLSFRTESGENVQVTINPTRDVLPYDFEVAKGVVLPKGAYSFTSTQVEFSTATHRAAYFDGGVTFGQFYSGRYTETRVGAGLKLKGYATLRADLDTVRGHLPQGDFSENVYQFKADFFLSPDLGLMNYIQYDDISRLLGWSARLRWQISPGNEIYLVYNKNWERRWDPISRFMPMEDRGVLKISLSIRP